MDEFNEDEALEELKHDQKNFDIALDHLIDSVSHFKSKQSLVDIEPEQWATMLETLDMAKFVVSGLMYSYGIPPCGHDHSDDEEEDDE